MGLCGEGQPYGALSHSATECSCNLSHRLSEDFQPPGDQLPALGPPPQKEGSVSPSCPATSLLGGGWTPTPEMNGSDPGPRLGDGRQDAPHPHLHVRPRDVLCSGPFPPFVAVRQLRQQ